MGKKKHKRFEECKTFSHLFQPLPEEMLDNDFYLKGKWNTEFFKNDKPIVLEIGCGKGEYTTGLAEKYPENNYIGIDIKGARLWRGSKTAQEKELKNAAFIRNKVEFLRSFFAEEEINEIWITFPDPQIRKFKKRLTSARFLKIYSDILKPGGIIHLKTDSVLMYNFTNKIIKTNKLNLIYSTDNLYNTGQDNELTQIKTHYEQSFLKEGMNITYLKFSLNNKYSFINYDKIS